MAPRFPQSTYDPLLHWWQQGPNVSQPPQPTAAPAPQIDTPAPPPVVPAPVAPTVEAPVPVAPKFQVTNETVTIHHGGSEFIYNGLQTIHRIHKDANGVEYISWNKVMQPLPNLNVQIVRRDIVKES